jgi:hypothetical protein
MQKGQANADNADDHNSDSAKPGPPKIVVAMLLLEPSNFSFITGPTNSYFRTVYDSLATVERFRFVNAFELGPPCCFHLFLSHRAAPIIRAT